MREATRIIGSSAALRQALAEADRLAATSLSVLIHGQTGTGKELVARRIHDKSARSKGPFIVIDCTQFPRELFESIAFGYEKGAFTGAVAARKGRFELADGGTVFLDEIAELPFEQQAKLLRVLQEGEVHPVGGSKPRKADVRVVAATNRNLVEMVKRGEFREDLYWRLVGDRIALPPLRERGRDVIAIAQALVERVAPDKRLTDQAEQLLLEYEWPGNVRQLQNVIEASAARTTGEWIEREAVWRQILRVTHFVSVDAVVEEGLSPANAAAEEGSGPVAVIEQGLGPADATVEKKPGPGVLHDTMLGLIEKRGAVSVAQLRKALRIRKERCREALDQLVSEGRVARQGTGPGTRYVAVAGSGSLTADSVTSRQREILEVLKTAPSMTLQQFREKLASPPSPRTLREELQRLRLRGQVGTAGRGRGARWFAVEQQEAG